MPTQKIFPIAALESAVKYTRRDLEKVRAIAAEAKTKIAALSDRKQYTAQYTASKVSEVKTQAQRDVTAYVEKEETFARIAALKGQEPYWTVRAFLSRSQHAGVELDATDQASNSTKLLKAILAATQLSIAVQSASRMSVAALEEAAQMAAEHENWPLVSVYYMELAGRAGAGDAPAERARNMVERIDIPTVNEANTLLEQSQHTGELIGYTTRALASGEDDLGIRMEGYQQLQAERDAAKAA